MNVSDELKKDDGITIVQNHVELLEKELKWAWENLKMVEPVADDESEYDFCVACGKPEWKHDGKCEGVKHALIAKELLNIYINTSGFPQKGN